MNALTIGVKIIVLATGKSYHTLADWELAVGNTDYIGEPVLETYSLDVFGRPGLLDMSESIAGRPIFKYRPITVKFGGIRSRMNWDHVISDFRNLFDGQRVQLIFDNDIGHYWEGRAYLKDFSRVQELGTFTLSIPQADPYKYDVCSSVDDWEWDSFDFETGVIRYIGELTITDSLQLTIPRGDMLTVPVITVSSMTAALSLSAKGKSYSLKVGRNRFPQLLVAGPEDVELTFSGSGTLSVDYRGGSL